MKRDMDLIRQIVLAVRDGRVSRHGVPAIGSRGV